MKNYDLNVYLGYKKEEIDEVEAVIFKDVTDLCEGESEDEKLEDFCINAEIGQFITYKGKQVLKVRNENGDSENVCEDEDGEMYIFK